MMGPLAIFDFIYNLHSGTVLGFPIRPCIFVFPAAPILTLAGTWLLFIREMLAPVSRNILAFLHLLLSPNLVMNPTFVRFLKSFDFSSIVTVPIG